MRTALRPAVRRQGGVEAAAARAACGFVIFRAEPCERRSGEAAQILDFREVRLADVDRLRKARAVRPTVGETFALDRAFEAYRLSETGRVRGKLVVRVE